MPITFLCPSGHLLRAGEEQVDRQVCCPICGEQAIVPAGNDRAPAGKRRETAPVDAVEVTGVGKDQPPPIPAVSGLEAGAASAEAEVRAGPPEPGSFPPLRPGRQIEATADQQGKRTTWVDWLPLPSRLPAAGAYQPDRGRVQTVRWLAFFLGLLVVFSALPALPHLDLQRAPGWARVVLLVAGLQAGYVVWMAVTPDWSTTRVAMVVFAAVSSLYGMATAVAIVTPLDGPLPLGMGEVRASAARWCGAVLLLMSLATYLCGLISFKWQRAAPGGSSPAGSSFAGETVRRHPG